MNSTFEKAGTFASSELKRDSSTLMLAIHIRRITLRKNLSALLSLVWVVFSVTTFVFAQQQANDPKVSADQIMDDAVQVMRQDIRSQRKQLVAASLPLTDTEATKFWPTYDRYIAETIKLNDTKYALIKDFSKNYNTLTDAQAQDYIRRWLASDADVTKLRQQWIPEFEKVISPKKTAMFMQIDRRVTLLVELQLASQVPLVKP